MSRLVTLSAAHVAAPVAIVSSNAIAASASSASAAAPSAAPAAAKQRLRVTVIGGGNLAHVLCGLIGSRSDDFVVHLMSRRASQLQEMVREGVEVRCMHANGVDVERVVQARIAAVTSKAEECIPQADLILITVPSHARPAVLRQIAPFLPKRDSGRMVMLGALPGIGGFDFIARSIVTEALHPASSLAAHALASTSPSSSSSHISIFALKDVPYMSAHTVPGRSVTMLGAKTGLYLALADFEAEAAERCRATIEAVCQIPTTLLQSFLTITLTPGNPIMHPALMYGAYGPHSQWDSKPVDSKPLFYEHCSELSAYFLAKCDAEIQAIRAAIQARTGLALEAIWPLRLNLKQVYGDQVEDNRTLLLALRTNHAYRSIRTPLRAADGGVGFTIDLGHRFFLEDVPFGLIVLHDIAQLVNVPVPTITEIALWAQKLMGREYIDPLPPHALTGRDAPASGAPSVWNVKSLVQLTRGANFDEVRAPAAHLQGKL